MATLALPFNVLLAQTPVAERNATEASLSLPDAPGLLAADSNSASSSLAELNSRSAPPAKIDPSPSGTPLPEASRTEMLIEPGQIAPTLKPGDKVLAGAKDSVSLFAAVGWVASAGYEQLFNGSPNYGTDRGAFGQRLGAAAIRDISEEIFSDAVMAPILHEDPRYYRLGPSHNFFVRGLYAATRPIITRTDGGRLTPNFAELSGTLAGAGLTNAYYPQVNRGATQTFETFGGSLGGSAVGYVVSEFFEDITALFHKHK